MDLALEQIRSFIAVVDLGGYHRAAEALHLSQPAVSKHVRRLQDQVGGGPLFERRGRGVELTARGEAVVTELRRIVDVHDEALARLSGDAGRDAFTLGTIEHLCDPMLPELLAAARGALDTPVRLRVDRSQPLIDRVAAGEVGAAIVLNAHDTPGAIALGDVPLRWWTGGPLHANALPSPLPVVAYDPPCGLRDLQLRHLDAAGIPAVVTAESAHLTGIQAAVRSGIGIALLAGGADGLRPIEHGPLAETLSAPLWLIAAERYRHLADPLRAALWAAGTRARRRAA